MSELIDCDGYSDALSLAGATVHDYLESGDYQGWWIAAVEYGGKRGWILDSYGSCSGCDALLSEFEYEAQPLEKIASFAKLYLDCLKTTTEVMKELAGLTWDESTEGFISFLEKNRSWVDGA